MSTPDYSPENQPTTSPLLPARDEFNAHILHWLKDQPLGIGQGASIINDEVSYPAAMGEGIRRVDPLSQIATRETWVAGQILKSFGVDIHSARDARYHCWNPTSRPSLDLVLTPEPPQPPETGYQSVEVGVYNFKPYTIGATHSITICSEHMTRRKDGSFKHGFADAVNINLLTDDQANPIEYAFSFQTNQASKELDLRLRVKPDGTIVGFQVPDRHAWENWYQAEYKRQTGRDLYSYDTDSSGPISDENRLRLLRIAETSLGFEKGALEKRVDVNASVRRFISGNIWNSPNDRATGPEIVFTDSQ